eukprot:TRINITY_DN280_c1_g2_i1.p1 TRINITY_DN280_c1_g2~~TRINITY_DN280_c1_g2_i1.p1  ORF type:complete len:470 (+),score=71.61 TRINITY_DN280_c1_g2_i1:46-1455(+)
MTGRCAQILFMLSTTLLIGIRASEELIVKRGPCESLNDVMLVTVNTDTLVAFSASSCAGDGFLSAMVCEEASCSGPRTIADYGSDITAFDLSETNGTYAVAYARKEAVTVKVGQLLETTIPVAVTPNSIAISYSEESASHIVLWGDAVTISAVIFSEANRSSWSQNSDSAFDDNLFFGYRNPITIAYSNFFIAFAQSEHRIVAAIIDASTGSVVGSTTPILVQSSSIQIVDFSATLLNDTNDTITISSVANSGMNPLLSVSLVFVDISDATGEPFLVVESFVDEHQLQGVSSANMIRAAAVTILGEESLAIGISTDADILLTTIDLETGNASSSFNTKVIASTNGRFAFDIATSDNNEGLTVTHITQEGIYYTSLLDIMSIPPTVPPMSVPDVVVVVVEDDTPFMSAAALVILIVTVSCCVAIAVFAFLLVKNNRRRRLNSPTHLDSSSLDKEIAVAIPVGLPVCSKQV